MGVGTLRSSTMEQLHHSKSYRESAKDYRENWTTGGLVAYLLVLPALLVLMTVPSVVLGVVLGIVGVKLGERFLQHYRRRAFAVEYVKAVCIDSRSAV